jgi:hypothetical protein
MMTKRIAVNSVVGTIDDLLGCQSARAPAAVSIHDIGSVSDTSAARRMPGRQMRGLHPVTGGNASTLSVVGEAQANLPSRRSSDDITVSTARLQ